jgi:hypothetical protein
MAINATDHNGHTIVDKAELHYADGSVMWPRLMKDSESASEIAGLSATGIFVTTHWSVVVQAGDAESPDALNALASLCQTYWDLRKIRQQLAPMKLDWDLPAYPPSTLTAPPAREISRR